MSGALFRSVVSQVRSLRPEGVSAEDLEAFLTRHGALLRRELEVGLAEALSDAPDVGAPLVAPGTDLWEHFSAQGAPRPGERGYRPPEIPQLDLARGLLDAALAEVDTPEFFWSWEAAQRFQEGELWNEDLEEDGLDPLELVEWLGVPGRIGKRHLDAEEQVALSLWVVQLAMEVEGRALSRGGSVQGQGPMARWVADGLLADLLTPTASLRLVNVPREAAAAFIQQHHQALPYLNPRGLMYAVGAEKNGRLVAVATAGSPTGRWSRLDPRNVLELTRLASDGTTKNAASMLVARLLDLRDASRRGRPDAPALFVTYQLTEAEGAVYRALQDKGLRCVARVKGRKPGGARKGSTDALAELDKYRWEAA